ncbi:MAG: esterase-like activity of phytase family protein [Proteobacteria bacterium]|nr:esterase-like activity of phytase family protein [Pseudomonadota bacterium]
MNKIILLTCSIILLLLLNCKLAISQNSEQKPIELKLIPFSEIILPKEIISSNVKIGGISGAFYEKDSSIIRTISDDNKGDVHGYDFNIELIKAPNIKFELNFLREFSIKSNKKFRICDSEDIDRDIYGYEYVVSEGCIDNSTLSNIEAGIFKVRKYGSTERRISSEVKTSLRFTKRIENNFGFEALCYEVDSNKKELLVTANESALKRDDTPASFIKGSLIRIARFSRYEPKAPFIKEKEFAYEISSIPQAKLNRKDDIFLAINGLVDILALGNNRYLTLERAAILYSDTKSKDKIIDQMEFSIRIFEIDLNAAYDVSEDKFLSIIDKSRITTKRLVLDLSSPEVLDQISKDIPSSKRIDNFESLSYGPLLPNGNPSLILFADDNFNPIENNLVLFLELLK